jgi:hypothetical protein
MLCNTCSFFHKSGSLLVIGLSGGRLGRASLVAGVALVLAAAAVGGEPGGKKIPSIAPSTRTEPGSLGMSAADTSWAERLLTILDFICAVLGVPDQSVGSSPMSEAITRLAVGVATGATPVVDRATVLQQAREARQIADANADALGTSDYVVLRSSLDTLIRTLEDRPTP